MKKRKLFITVMLLSLMCMSLCACSKKSDKTEVTDSTEKAVVEKDTRDWYIVGDGKSSVLTDGEWAKVDDETIKNAARLSKTGKFNEFEITVDLYKGDEFQLIPDWSWKTQIGYGYIEEANENLYEKGDSYSSSDDGANIKILRDGNYTVTLSTNPEDVTDTELTIAFNGKAVGDAVAGDASMDTFTPSETTEVYVKGSWTKNWDNELYVDKVSGDDSYLYSIDIYLEENTELYFMIYEQGFDSGLGLKYENVTESVSKALLNKNDNIKVKYAGSYRFTVDLINMTVELQLLDLDQNATTGIGGTSSSSRNTTSTTNSSSTNSSTSKTTTDTKSNSTDKSTTDKTTTDKTSVDKKSTSSVNQSSSTDKNTDKTTDSKSTSDSTNMGDTSTSTDKTTTTTTNTTETTTTDKATGTDAGTDASLGTTSEVPAVDSVE